MPGSAEWWPASASAHPGPTSTPTSYAIRGPDPLRPLRLTWRRCSTPPLTASAGCCSFPPALSRPRKHATVSVQPARRRGPAGSMDVSFTACDSEETLRFWNEQPVFCGWSSGRRVAPASIAAPERGGAINHLPRFCKTLVFLCCVSLSICPARDSAYIFLHILYTKKGYVHNLHIILHIIQVLHILHIMFHILHIISSANRGAITISDYIFHQQSGECIYMQNMQNIDLSVFCILKTGLHIFEHIFCILNHISCYILHIILHIYWLILYFAHYFAYLLKLFAYIC
jgi:hypothetical protein